MAWHRDFENPPRGLLEPQRLRQVAEVYLAQLMPVSEM